MYTVDGQQMTAQELIDYAIDKGWQPGPVRFTSLAAKYLRSIGIDVH